MTALGERPGAAPTSAVTGDHRRARWAGASALLACLCGLNFLDNVDSVAFGLLGPDIQRALGFSDAMLGAIAGASGILVVVAAVPLGHLADRSRRTRLAAGAGLAAGLFVLATALVTSAFQLLLVRLLSGAGKAAITPVHSSLIADSHSLSERSRAFSLHALAGAAAPVLGPLLIGLLALVTSGWRAAFVMVALAILAVAVLTALRGEPERGRFEREQDDAELAPLLAPEEFRAGVRRLIGIRSLSRLFLGVGVLGFAIVGAPTFFSLLLERDYDLGVGGRGIVGAVTSIGGVAGILLGGRIGERLITDHPDRAMRAAAAAVAGFGIVFAASLYLPNLPLVVLGVTIANALIYAVIVPGNTIIAAAAPYHLRALGFSMLGIYVFVLGGFLGGVIIGGLSAVTDVRTALLLVIPVSSVGGAWLIASGAPFVIADIAANSDRAAATAVMPAITADRHPDPGRDTDPALDSGTQDTPASDQLSDSGETLLQVQGVDFSYGKVQVLFGVDLDVREGEVLALLGTNGAGKSTLLKVITGLGRPSAGTVSLAGEDLARLPTEDRVERGIVYLPGGKAIFPGLSVAENLLAGAHGFIWQRDRVEAKIAEVLDYFPRLRERLDQPAGLLSGGEQQQLALAKALLLDPKVLCIDELSLGLAPVVVQDILTIVRRLKAEGLTMVIVEQSLNVALSIADRAVFMEKGEIRFEGPAADLLARDDLVRAVFLGAENR